MTNDEESYRPRETDHLVEPMFEGLGMGEGEADAEETDPESPRSGAQSWFLTRLLGFFGLR